MVTREETNKMRKELVRAERILAQKERARETKLALTPIQLKKEKDRPEPKTADVPNVIHLPKRKRQRKENIPFF